MARGIGLEELRKILTEDKLGIHCAIIKKLSMAADKSVLRVTVQLIPDNFTMVARMTWDAVGPEAGFFQLPVVGDLVLVAFVEGNEDEAYVIRRMTSKEDKIPIQAASGHSVIRALGGKKAYMVSDTNILFARGDAEPTERVVLGDTFKTAYSEHLQLDADHTHIGNLGYKTSPPDNFADMLAIKASPVDDALMLSDLTKTEK